MASLPRFQDFFANHDEEYVNHCCSPITKEGEHWSQTIILRINEAVYNQATENSLASDIQLRKGSHSLDAVPKMFGGKQEFHPTEDTVIPLFLKEALMTFNHRVPTREEKENLVHINITLDEPWDPKGFYDDMGTYLYNETVQVTQDDEEHAILKSTAEFQDQEIEPKVNNKIQDTNSNDFFGQIPQDTSLDDIPKLHKVRPSNPDYQKLSKYFAYRPIDIIRKTWNQTTQLVKSVLEFPMRRHFKSRFQMLRKPRLNEKVATDTYFASSRHWKGIHVHKFSLDALPRLSMFMV